MGLLSGEMAVNRASVPLQGGLPSVGTSGSQISACPRSASKGAMPAGSALMLLAWQQVHCRAFLSNLLKDSLIY